MTTNSKKKNIDKLEKLRTIATNNKCKLLSNIWEGSTSHYDFMFEDGRTFKITATNLLTNGWPKNPDSFLKKSLSQYKDATFFLTTMKNVAENRGGEALSSEWHGVEQKYLFRDGYGIEFSCRYDSFIKGQWSPDRGLVSEPICTQTMSNLFQTSFVKTRKILTKEVTGLNYNMELDGFSKDLNVAFEYQGHPSHWDRNRSDYSSTLDKDTLKKEICDRLNIMLIQIPPFIENYNKWKSENVIKHVINAIKKCYDNNNLLLPLPTLKIDNFEINFNIINHSPIMLYNLRQIIEKNNGKLLSTEWIGSSAKYLCQFQDGRKFEMSANQIQQGFWPKNPDIYFNLKKRTIKTY